VRRLAISLASASLILITSAVVGAPVRASAAPTINGPTVAAYYATVHLTGTTPEPNQAVVIYGRWAGQTGYAAVRTVRSRADGTFGVTYPALATRTYYARAGERNSAIRTTSLPQATCTVSRPAFGRLPFQHGNPAPAPSDAFSALTATRKGVWAGYAFLGYPQEWAVISWERGDRNATVLARFRAGSGTYYPNAHGNIDVAGVTPSGAVVAAVRTRNSSQNTTGFAWFHGRTYHLPKRAGWKSVHPNAVTDQGHILGWVRSVATGRSMYYLVDWPRLDKPGVPLLRLPRGGAQTMTVDGLGDVAYALPDGTARIRLRSGPVRELVSGGDQYTYVYDAAGRYLYGRDSRNVVVRWDLAVPPATGPVSTAVSVAGGSWVSAASSRGDLLVERYFNSDREVLRTAWGARVVTPKQLAPYGWAGQAIAEHGVVAFTAARDGLVHFLRCRPAS
jgi:hypothetical protein